MRILLLHDYGTLSGGAEVMVVNLRDALRKRGHQVLLFTSTAQPLPLPIAADETCFGTVSPLRRGLQACNPHAWFRLRQVLKSFQPDVVFVKMFLTQLSPLVLPLLREVPCALSVINYNLLCPLNTKTLPDGSPCHLPAGINCRSSGCMPWLGVARDAVQRRLTDLDVFDYIFANSSWVAERLREENVPVDGYVHLGVPQQDQRPPLGNRPTIAYAGRLVPKKGVDVLLSAMAMVHRQIPQARLLILGDGPERTRLEHLADKHGISQVVDFTGHLDCLSMEKILASAWVQAVPSLWEEPFGLVCVESMMRGTAVVASRSGGLTEQLTDGETGYLVPPGDTNSLAEALGRILADREHAEFLGQNGRQAAITQFTKEQYIDRVLEIFEMLKKD